MQKLELKPRTRETDPYLCLSMEIKRLFIQYEKLYKMHNLFFDIKKVDKDHAAVAVGFGKKPCMTPNSNAKSVFYIDVMIRTTEIEDYDTARVHMSKIHKALTQAMYNRIYASLSTPHLVE